MIIEIPGPPIPKKRHRSFMRNGFMSTYDPQSKQKDAVSYKLQFQANKEPAIKSQTAYVVEMEFYLPIAKSVSKPARSLISWRPLMVSKPDVDNMAKFYMDAANGILWDDDSQVVALTCIKRYSENPRTVMIITGVKPVELDEDTQGILGVFNKEMFDMLITDLRQLGDIHVNDAYSFDSKAKNSAMCISMLADKYATELGKIKKKWPNYWQNKELFRDGKTLS